MTLFLITTFIAAFVTGAMGYGFSSMTVPVGLLWYTSRVLNPTLIFLEIGMNLYNLFLNRSDFLSLFKKLRPLLFGMIPTLFLGSYFLRSMESENSKMLIYSILILLVILRGFGINRRFMNSPTKGFFLGGFLGIIYSLTTISGPPLSLALKNEKLSRKDFMASMGLIRSIESLLALATYAALGLLTVESWNLFWAVLPVVALGLLLGSLTLRKIDSEVFRRLSVSVDVVLVGLTFNRLYVQMNWGLQWIAFAVPIAMILIDLFNLKRQLHKSRQTGALNEKKTTSQRAA